VVVMVAVRRAGEWVIMDSMDRRWDRRAKRGWQLPDYDQLEQYARRLKNGEPRQRCILVVAECASYFPPVAALPKQIHDIPIRYLP
jgi:hypothetical protein